jgi:hypothetical protein
MIHFATADAVLWVAQEISSPSVYLDPWALREISESEALARRFSKALRLRGGALVLSCTRPAGMAEPPNAVAHGSPTGEAFWPSRAAGDQPASEAEIGFGAIRLFQRAGLASTREKSILLAPLRRVLLGFKHPPNCGQVGHRRGSRVPETT